MGCASSKVGDANEKAKPLMASYADRKCRDVFWLLLFIAYWVGMMVVAYFAFTYGDEARLLYGVDAFGNQCGGTDSKCYDGSACGKFQVFPRVSEDIARAMQDGVVITPETLLTIPYYSICVSSCPVGLSTESGARTWVCDYNTTAELNTLYPYPTETSLTTEKLQNRREIPSDDAKSVLEECLDIKNKKYSSIFGAFLMSDAEILADSSTAKCKTYMSSCFKSYAVEKDLFFRCVPQTDLNTTCAFSPYLEAMGESLQTVSDSEGNVYPRPASREYSCGKCLDPETDGNGDPMDPASSECKAVQIISQGEAIDVKVNPVFEQVNTWSSVLVRFMGDIKLTHVQILVSGTAVSIVIGIVWLVLLRYLAGVFVWAVVWALLLLFAFLTVQFLIYGQVIDTVALTDFLNWFSTTTGTDNSSNSQLAADILAQSDVLQLEADNQIQLYRIAGYTMLAVLIIYLLLIIAMARKIRLCVAVLKEGTKVIATMPTILFFPIGNVVASLLLSIYWIYSSMLLSSAGEVTAIELPGFIMNGTIAVNGTFGSGGNANLTSAQSDVGSVIQQELNSMSLTQLYWIYNFFGYLWTNQLLSAISMTTIAGAVGSWYWASEFETEKSKKMPTAPVFASLKRVFRFHLGSLAFGAFIIAVVQLIRAALAYLDKQTRGLQQKNKIVKYVMKIVQCCLWCFEKILKFLTKNAYIMIAIKGSSFCSATKDAFMLVIKHFAQIGVAAAITNLICLLAKLVIATGSGAVCWLMVTSITVEIEKPSSVLIPVFVSALLSWFVASQIISVYALAVDTILVSFCLDSDNNDGSPNKPYYMTESLKRITRKSNKMYKREERNDKEEDEDEKTPVEQPSAPPAKQLL